MSRNLCSVTSSTISIQRKVHGTQALHGAPQYPPLGPFGKREKNVGKVRRNEKKGIFRIFDVGLRQPYLAQRKRVFREPPRVQLKVPPREKAMLPDQDWPSVWPAARTFHPASVPLPLRQGVIQQKKLLPPEKYANTELMKIPNFLHLTPPAINRHCEAIKKFCTPWPKELENEELLEAHFPIQEITSDYLNSSSSLRDFRARVITFQFKLSSLFLDPTSREKFERLVGDRYNADTDLVTITVDRCPYRKQNREYCEYLIKALYYESRNRADWEADIQEVDKIKFEVSEDQVNEITDKLAKVLNEGENQKTLDDYKSAVLSKLKLKNYEIPISPSN